MESDQEIPSDYEEEFNEPPKDERPPKEQASLDIFPISGYFSETPTEEVRKESRTGKSVPKVAVLREDEAATAPLQKEDGGITHAVRNDGIRRLPQATPEILTPSPNTRLEDEDIITVLESPQTSSPLLSRSPSPLPVLTMPKQTDNGRAPIARPRLLSVGHSSPSRSFDPLNERQVIPSLNVSKRGFSPPELKNRSIERLSGLVKQSTDSPTQQHKFIPKLGLKREQELSAHHGLGQSRSLQVSQQKHQAGVSTSKLSKLLKDHGDDDFPDEISETEQERWRGNRMKKRTVSPSAAIQPRSRSAVPMVSRTKPSHNSSLLGPGQLRPVRRARTPLSEEEKVEQEKRYQVIKEKTKARLQMWDSKKSAVTQLENQHGDLNSTFMVGQNNSLNAIRGKIIRERQHSVKIPRFPVKVEKTFPLRPTISTNLPLRREKTDKPATSNGLKTPVRSTDSDSKPALTPYPASKADLGLIDFTVNDSKNSPQESYWLYMAGYSDAQELHINNDIRFNPLEKPLLRQRRNSHTSLLSRNTAKAELGFYDVLLLTTENGPKESQAALRSRYDQYVRRRLQGRASSSNSLPRSRRPSLWSETNRERMGNSSKAGPVPEIEHFRQDRAASSAGDRSEKENNPRHVTEEKNFVHLTANLKSQAMLKLAAINDFTPENLELAVADFYDYFRGSPSYRMLSSREISTVLTTVFEELMFV